MNDFYSKTGDFKKSAEQLLSCHICSSSEYILLPPVVFFGQTPNPLFTMGVLFPLLCTKQYLEQVLRAHGKCRASFSLRLKLLAPGPEGAEQLLTQLAVFTLVTDNFCLLCSSSRRQSTVFRDETLVPSFLYTVVQSTEIQSPCSVEEELTLHGKICNCYTLGLHLQIQGVHSREKVVLSTEKKGLESRLYTV